MPRAAHFKLLISFIILFQTYCFGSCPRVIITCDPALDKDLFKEALNAYHICGAHQEMLEQIQLLDLADHHIFLLEQPLNNMYWSCRNLGYAYLHLIGEIQECMATAKEFIASVPQTSNELPYLPPEEIGKFYDLLIKVDRIFRAHDFFYWATCGTLLGAVRHQGMIPWDDDLDFAYFAKDTKFLLSLKEVLNQEGMDICLHPDFKFYKIFFINGEEILDENGMPYPWKYPFMDLFPLVQKNNRFVYAYKPWASSCYNDYYTKSDLRLPLDELPFGPLTIPVSHNCVKHIQAVYGDDWNEVAYVQYSHKLEQRLTKVKVDLVDRSPPHYILPK